MARREVIVVGGKRVTLTGVYAIGPKARAPLKIGYSNNVPVRLTELQEGHWEELFIHLTIWVPDNRAAQRLEKRIHAELASRRRHGTWFGVDPGEALSAIEAAAKSEHIPIHGEADLDHPSVSPNL
jgi:hypothetical protein